MPSKLATVATVASACLISACQTTKPTAHVWVGAGYLMSGAGGEMILFSDRRSSGIIPTDCISLAATSPSDSKKFAKLDGQVVQVRGRKIPWPNDVHSVNWGAGPVMNVCFKEFVIVTRSIQPSP